MNHENYIVSRQTVLPEVVVRGSCRDAKARRVGAACEEVGVVLLATSDAIKTVAHSALLRDGCARSSHRRVQQW